MMIVILLERIMSGIKPPGLRDAFSTLGHAAADAARALKGTIREARHPTTGTPAAPSHPTRHPPSQTPLQSRTAHPVAGDPTPGTTVSTLLAPRRAFPPAALQRGHVAPTPFHNPFSTASLPHAAQPASEATQAPRSGTAEFGSGSRLTGRLAWLFGRSAGATALKIAAHVALGPLSGQLSFVFIFARAGRTMHRAQRQAQEHQAGIQKVAEDTYASRMQQHFSRFAESFKTAPPDLAQTPDPTPSYATGPLPQGMRMPRPPFQPAATQTQPSANGPRAHEGAAPRTTAPATATAPPKPGSSITITADTPREHVLQHLFERGGVDLKACHDDVVRLTSKFQQGTLTPADLGKLEKDYGLALPKGPLSPRLFEKTFDILDGIRDALEPQKGAPAQATQRGVQPPAA